MGRCRRISRPGKENRSTSGRHARPSTTWIWPGISGTFESPLTYADVVMLSPGIATRLSTAICAGAEQEPCGRHQRASKAGRWGTRRCEPDRVLIEHESRVGGDPPAGLLSCLRRERRCPCQFHRSLDEPVDQPHLGTVLRHDAPQRPQIAIRDTCGAYAPHPSSEVRQPGRSIDPTTTGGGPAIGVGTRCRPPTESRSLPCG